MRVIGTTIINKKAIVQHTSCAICEFSGIIVFKSYFRLVIKTRFQNLTNSLRLANIIGDLY